MSLPLGHRAFEGHVICFHWSKVSMPKKSSPCSGVLEDTSGAVAGPRHLDIRARAGTHQRDLSSWQVCQGRCRYRYREMQVYKHWLYAFGRTAHLSGVLPSHGAFYDTNAQDRRVANS